MKFSKTILKVNTGFENATVSLISKKFLGVNGPLGVSYMSLNNPNFIKLMEYSLFYNQLHKKDIALKEVLSSKLASVTLGYYVELVITGLGFRVKISETGHLLLNLGYSHAFAILIPKSINLLINKDKILVFGGDVLEVGNFANKVTRLRPLDSYKGKGIRVLSKEIKLKEGKKQKL